MVAGHDGELVGAEVRAQEAGDHLELGFEREVDEVARAEGVVDFERRDGFEQADEDLGAVVARAVEREVDRAGPALVEESLRSHALEREHVGVGEVGDAHGAHGSSQVSS
jgi:hypothetical protein